MRFKSASYTYSESAGEAVVEVVLTGQLAADVVVLVQGGM